MNHCATPDDSFEYFVGGIGVGIYLLSLDERHVHRVIIRYSEDVDDGGASVQSIIQIIYWQMYFI